MKHENITPSVFVAELGDYNSEEYRENYLSECQFIPNQTEEFEKQVADLHKQHRYCNSVQICTFYGYMI